MSELSEARKAFHEVRIQAAKGEPDRREEPLPKGTYTLRITRAGVGRADNTEDINRFYIGFLNPEGESGPEYLSHDSTYWIHKFESSEINPAVVGRLASDIATALQLSDQEADNIYDKVEGLVLGEDVGETPENFMSQLKGKEVRCQVWTSDTGRQRFKFLAGPE